MKKNLLLIFLIICLLIEFALAVFCFYDPKAAMELFKVSYTDDTAFMAYVIAWFCILVSVFCVYGLILLLKGKEGYVMIIYILSFWWVGIGLGIYFIFKRPENLLADSLKGVILALLNYSYSNKKIPVI